MSWDGQPSIKLCPDCIARAKAMLDGRYFSLRPIPKPVVLSDDEKKCLKNLGEDFLAPEIIGFNQKFLVCMVTKRYADMTRAGGKLYFRRRKKKNEINRSLQG